MSLRFMPAQFRRDGVAWQQIEARPMNGFSRCPPSLNYWASFEEPEAPLFLASSVLPRQAREGTTPEEKQRGLRRFYVPVANPLDEMPGLREVGTPDSRVEPAVEVVRELTLTVEGDAGKVTLPFPAFEGLGRKAPQREFRQLDWPSFTEVRTRLPEPVLPESHAWLSTLYWAAWEMLCGLMRQPKPESGLPNGYIGTASRNFLVHQFVWDSSFTAMCTAYGWRGLHAYATLDVLYSRQFDGGYIHREHDVRDGMPAAYEPDFSPNPPIMSLAEWAIAGLTGDQLRLAKVYPALKDMHKWLEANRRLPDGTYWTTGLANGLDNSPSLGDGYPCLTAQMAHEAEILGKMARVLGLDTDAAAWEAEHVAIAKALNEHLWSEAQQIYATSLAGGGHNPHKVVTAFWPLWAGIVPAERIASLALHFKDPRSFWRHHPLPSLAADSPCFKPAGDYWLGSTWAPTNFAAIKGIDRAGRHEIAVEAALRHLKCMTEVYQDTGHIWENYCSEKSARGSCSGPDYCWSSLGPIAMLMEIVIGLQGDALSNRLCWNLPREPGFGVQNLALGPATISLRSEQDAAGKRWVSVTTDRSFILEITAVGKVIRQECRAGHTRVEVA